MGDRNETRADEADTSDGGLNKWRRRAVSAHRHAEDPKWGQEDDEGFIEGRFVG